MITELESSKQIDGQANERTSEHVNKVTLIHQTTVRRTNERTIVCLIKFRISMRIANAFVLMSNKLISLIWSRTTWRGNNNSSAKMSKIRFFMDCFHMASLNWFFLWEKKLCLQWMIRFLYIYTWIWMLSWENIWSLSKILDIIKNGKANFYINFESTLVSVCMCACCD